MNSSKLSPLIDISSFSSLNDIFDYLYSIYMNDYMNRFNRPGLNGRFIFIDCKTRVNNKTEMFWHMISLSESESFNVFPCNSDVSLPMCDGNCITKSSQIIMNSSKKRNTCLYRGIRIRWVNDIINLANNRDPNIRMWRKREVSKGQQVIKLYIRFKHETTDYIIVFEEMYRGGVLSHYNLLTGFPIFYINSKTNYEQDYNCYIKNGV